MDAMPERQTMLKHHVLRLEHYSEPYRERLLQFSLPPEQAVFTGMPSETLDEAAGSSDKMPVVVTVDGQAVGFFILHTGPDVALFYADWPRTVLLRGLLVDAACQGRGIAGCAMERLPDFVRREYPEAVRIVLAVNERNSAALRLYGNAGFQDRGLRREGTKGRQLILEYGL